MKGRTIFLLCVASALLGAAVPVVIQRSFDRVDVRMHLLRVVNRGAFRPEDFAK